MEENEDAVMSTYVMSDLHGNYKAYKDMLEKIEFSNADTLFILGDILDRGPHPIKIILDVMNRPNVEVLAGNHCMMALECMSFLMREVTLESLAELNIEKIEKLVNWQQNGAETTINEFRKCNTATRQTVFEFISELDVYDEVEIGEKTFILVHAGLGNFSPDKQMWEYELNELVWDRPDYEKMYFPDKYIISGHTPTMAIKYNPRPGYIYQANHNIAIDCGCNFPGGRLACLRLEDMKEFYVETEGSI